MARRLRSRCEIARSTCCSSPAAKDASGFPKWKRWPSKWSRREPIAPASSLRSAAASSTTWADSSPPSLCAACRCSRFPPPCSPRWTRPWAGNGANLVSGKNLIGTFHQPLAVLIDPSTVATLPEREYRAGLYEIVKCGVIRDSGLFDLFENERDRVLNRNEAVVDHIVSAAVCIKAEVVSKDEREGGLRRMLNYGHTIGHALEAETSYVRFLHGEAVAFGMIAAARLGTRAAGLSEREADRIAALVAAYGPIPPLDGIDPERLFARLGSDKKTLQGHVHFVLPERIGAVKVVTGVAKSDVIEAIEWAVKRYSGAQVVA